jgi:hypothetical protein
MVMAAEAAMAPEAPTEIPPPRAAPVAAPPLKPVKGDGGTGTNGTKGKEAKKEKKGKKGKKDDEVGDGAAGEGPNIAAHPRAARAVARAKGWGGLIGFLLGGYLSMSSSTFAEVGMRALAGGVVCYVAAWAGAVFIWRRLVIVEVKAREQQLIAAAQAASSRPAPSGESAAARASS